CQQGSSGPLTF
nr:immunoglobulin light chain junction region [Mus musculus]